MNDNQEYLFLDHLQVKWFSDGDEWINWFKLGLAQDDSGLVYSGLLYDDTTKPLVRFTVKSNGDSDLAFRFYIVPLTDSVVLVVDIDDTPEVEVLQEIQRAARLATERIGEEGPEHEWSAIVGHPVSRISGEEVFLANSGQLADIFLESSGKMLVEVAGPIERPSLSSTGIRASIPILARGTTRGYSSESAMKSAAEQLTRLCRLLSVAWGHCVTIRESPAPLSWGERMVPENQLRPNLTIDESGLLRAERGRELRDWLAGAWDRMLSAPWIADAVAAHHEGLRAQFTHPSLALVAFVASIEAVSQRVYHEERCATCEGHRNISAKFRKVLALVLDEDEAKALGNVYSPRSKIVHRGKLYGGENSVGSFRFSIWSPGQDRDFKWNTLYKIRRASEDLLTLALKGQLPPKMHLGETAADNA